MSVIEGANWGMKRSNWDMQLVYRNAANLEKIKMRKYVM